MTIAMLRVFEEDDDFIVDNANLNSKETGNRQKKKAEEFLDEDEEDNADAVFDEDDYSGADGTHSRRSGHQRHQSNDEDVISLGTAAAEALDDDDDYSEERKLIDREYDDGSPVDKVSSVAASTKDESNSMTDDVEIMEKNADDRKGLDQGTAVKNKKRTVKEKSIADNGYQANKISKRKNQLGQRQRNRQNVAVALGSRNSEEATDDFDNGAAYRSDVSGARNDLAPAALQRTSETIGKYGHLQLRPSRVKQQSRRQPPPRYPSQNEDIVADADSDVINHRDFLKFDRKQNPDLHNQEAYRIQTKRKFFDRGNRQQVQQKVLKDRSKKRSIRRAVNNQEAFDEEAPRALDHDDDYEFDEQGTIEYARKEICKYVQTQLTVYGFTGAMRPGATECDVQCERSDGKQANVFHTFHLKNWPCGTNLKGRCSNDGKCDSTSFAKAER
ncbi:hypothetical protein BV898_08868 [Hypsibius exemplaris]|uniref:Uncharacterized protein n=1 Tax=Hypsibius exemplaris TaxID=2072580 RepID=A0A1W0WPD4_HYPEX|nr:hypothetical protein BV898_08868 [Hypsibius exemplaris]